ncbi:MAG TPA: DUF4097 family beta strand repeat-containing protein [Terriglobales bacterium]|nr:DUF4097 family beta strand repeat-containing protein [Terriglobales bacterium]
MRQPSLILALGVLLSTIPALSQESGQSLQGTKTCADINMSFDERPMARSEQHLTFSLSEAPTLAVGHDEDSENSGFHNGGIEVTGWDRDQYAVTVCKSAAGETQAEAQQVLGQIQVQRNGGTLTVTGPERNDDAQWNVMLLVSAPRSAKLDLSTHNGPLAVKNMTGGGELRAQNGPIRLKDSTGDFTVDTHNGPIAFSGTGGNVKLSAKNGPITVDVSGEQFTGELSGDAKNGPIQLMLPAKFSSGVEVENDNAPISCSADLCQAEGNVWVNGHHIKIGTSNAIIHLTTEHGPVTVQNRKKL